METVAKKEPRPRRSFTPEFKADAVALFRSSGRSIAGDRTIAQVCRDFNLTETAVRRWVEQAKIDSGDRAGLTSAEREEIRELRQENRRLQADVDLLKRAMSFFAKETR